VKIALVGYGRMGHVVEEVAAERGIEILDRFTRERPLRANGDTRRSLGGITAVVDFSVADAVLDTADAAAELGLPLAIGTTGWLDRMDDLRTVAEQAGIGVVHGSNFSIGVNVFYRIVERAAQLFSTLEGYDPFVTDWHHRFKLDAPSGTALELRRRMALHYGDREVPITSQRAGYVPSVHTVGFDSPGDLVRIEHQARNRQGFADGALVAADWIDGRQGFHAFGEVVDDLWPQ
jgi:4-hydroxy-tetrahydrodipicolinate reductase